MMRPISSRVGIPVEKIALVKEVASVLGEMPLADVNLYLRECEVWPLHEVEWEYEPSETLASLKKRRDKRLKESLSELTFETLDNLRSALAWNSESAGVEKLARDQRSQLKPLTLFASHLADHKAFVSKVSQGLNSYGISLFVAHDAIEPGTIFEDEIRRSLDSVDGAVFFIHQGFRESAWCDQEVGWLMGRKVPFHTIRFTNEAPHGFISPQQALTVQPDISASRIARDILDWCSNSVKFRPRLIDSLLVRLEKSLLFTTTDELWSILGKIETMSEFQLDELLRICMKNDQVHNAECRAAGIKQGQGKKYPEAIALYVSSQRQFNPLSEESIRFQNTFNLNLEI
jgi:hypothetical protein